VTWSAAASLSRGVKPSRSIELPLFIPQRRAAAPARGSSALPKAGISAAMKGCKALFEGRPKNRRSTSIPGRKMELTIPKFK